MNNLKEENDVFRIIKFKIRKMGIPLFYGRWIKKRFGYNVILNRLPSYISSLSMDLNSLFHLMARKVYATDPNLPQEIRDGVIRRMKDDLIGLQKDYLTTVNNEIQRIFDLVRPNSLLVLAVDGVAPEAKIIHQRVRRFNTSRHPSHFDSNCFTPGTEMMIDIDRSIRNWLVNNKKYLSRKIIYSSHMVHGEGEHKIMEYFRRGVFNDPQYPEGSHIIYGMDADLIILSLCSRSKNIYLFRDDPIRGGFDILSIDNLREEIKCMMNGGKPGFIEGNESIDFALLTFFLGNDFLPHQPSLEDMDNALDHLIFIYQQLHLPLTHQGAIIPNNFLQFIQQCAASEDNWLLDVSQMECQAQLKILIESLQIKTEVNPQGIMVRKPTLDFPIFREKWYQLALFPRNLNQFESETRKKFTLSLGDLVQMSQDYFNALNWVLWYYLEGTDRINPQFFYPYFYTPLFQDIYGFLYQFISDKDGKQLSLTNNIVKKRKESYPTLFQQLITVLPRSSSQLLPIEIRHIALADSIFGENYPISWMIDETCRRMAWEEGVSILPFPYPPKVKGVIDKYSHPLSETRKDLFSETTDLVLISKYYGKK